MKISVYGIPDLTPGKYNIKDSRLDEVDKITKAKKKTYIQIEVVGEEYRDSDAILASEDSLTDLVIKDLDFIETRIGRSEDPEEKKVLEKLKDGLEKETLVFNMPLEEIEKNKLSGYALATNRPVIIVKDKEIEDKNALLSTAMREGGYISFFTTGEKETRAWLIKKGMTAWEASGQIHSDIQKGFIRAEIISFQDFISCGGETRAKQAGKMRLEGKDYIMQDCDLANFRFNR